MGGTDTLAGTLMQAQTQATAGRQAALTNSLSSVSQAKMKERAQEFESFYLYQVLELMTPENNSEFNGGVGEDMFRHQMNEELAKNMVQHGGFGLSNAVYAELLRQQQGTAAAAGTTANATQ